LVVVGRRRIRIMQATCTHENENDEREFHVLNFQLKREMWVSSTRTISYCCEAHWSWNQEQKMSCSYSNCKSCLEAL
jgi:hypothetical protein